jgi:hypothetical protein
MGKYEPDREALIKLSKFFQVPIDYILGGDFIRWDIDRMSYPDIDAMDITSSDMSVSESIAAYSINNKNNKTVESVTTDCLPGVLVEISASDIITKTAFYRKEFEGLTSEEVDMLAEYADFIKSRRKSRA